MSNVDKKSVKYLLLGAGYTLSRLCREIDPALFIATTRSQEKLAALKLLGYNAEIGNIADISSIEKIFNKYPFLEKVLDSAPPLNEDNEELSRFSALLEKRRLKHIIYLSTSGVFGVDDGSWVDESSKANPNNAKSRARLKAEEIYRRSNLKFTAFRVAAIYGPGRGIGTALKEGRYKIISEANRWSNRIHVDDLVAACKKALLCEEHSKIADIICLSDNKPTTVKEIVEFYTRRFRLPFPDTISIEQAKAANLHSLSSNQRIDNKRLREFLQNELQYPSYMEGAETEFC